jgi:hypothetical protein
MSARPLRLEEFFKLEGAVNIPGRGVIYAGQLLMNFGESQLLGMRMTMNDVPMRVAGVEHFMTPDPFRRGARVGLKLEPL